MTGMVYTLKFYEKKIYIYFDSFYKHHTSSIDPLYPTFNITVNKTVYKGENNYMKLGNEIGDRNLLSNSLLSFTFPPF